MLPQNPAGAEHLTEDEHATLLKRDSMVGDTIIPDFAT